MPSYNYYPATYQSPMGYPQYAQASMPQVQTPQMSMASQPQTGNHILWVQGEIGAKAYPVSPGSSLLLMDSDDSRFYIKSADASGMPLPLRIFSYTEEVPSQQSYDSGQQIDTSKFITREELEELEERIMARQQAVKEKKEK